MPASAPASGCTRSTTMPRARVCGCVERFAERMHRTGRHAGRVERRRSIRRACACAAPRSSRSTSSSRCSHARRVGREARIVAPLGMAEHIGNALPVRLVRAADVDVAVARLETPGTARSGCAPIRAGPATLPWRSSSPRASTSVAARPRSATCRRSGRVPVFEAMRIRSHDAERGEDSRVDVGHGIAVLHRRPPGLAGDRHESGEALRDQVEAALVRERSVAAESGDRAIDERSDSPRDSTS